jgi:phosphatidylglycerol lysyltransferase
LWLAWYVSSYFDKPFLVPGQSIVNRLIAWWVALNGVGAIVLDLAHLHYFPLVGGLYIGDDTAWLAQHGVIIGVAFLYISRHFARGERRAWQLLLLLLGVEIIKYAVIVPQPVLLAVYLVTFAVLFVWRGYFTRGTAVPSWQSRMADVAVILSGAAVAVLVIDVVLTYMTKHRNVLVNALTHYQEFVLQTDYFTRTHVRSSLLAHTLTALLAALVWFVLWALFRPVGPRSTVDYDDRGRAEVLLGTMARSSEDFFKLWPTDKYYFWSADRRSFVAYKVVSAVAYALADPIGPSHEAISSVLADFLAYCRTQGWRTCFVMVTERSLPMYHGAGLNTLHVGASAIVNVKGFTTETMGDKWWRWQRNRVERQGYSYEYHQPPHSPTLLADMQRISDAWLAKGKHREQGFALGYFDETYLQYCTVHTLYDADGRMVAFMNEVPIFNHLPQTTVDLMRFMPDAPHAMSALLMYMLMQLHEQGRYTHFDLGFVPLAQMPGKLPVAALTLSIMHFSAAGLERFKNKFKPNWQANYLAYDGDLADLVFMGLNLERVVALRLPHNKDKE